MINKALFTSYNQNWETPERFYNILNKEFKFDFDPCPKNPKFDGLIINWKKRNFVNPPYNKIKKWLIKGYEEYLNGKLVVFLIPSRTDTSWFHDFVMKATEIRFIRGRLKFSGFKNSAPFPSMIVVFDPAKRRKK